MAVSFHSSDSHISYEVGDYQQFPKPEPEDAASEKTPKPGETEEERCPQGWLMFGSSCYNISSERNRLSWDDSRRVCRQRGADLVIINSRQEQAFLTGFTMQAWVGMTDREEEGTWVWVDGTPVNKDGLIWAPGQPDDAFDGEDCGDLRTMIDFIGLNDVSCSVRIRWICEKNLTVA
ncbi:C-type lectin domain family 4 member M-like isoform X2 [Sebastes fasciatus]|uniref:C-type lectin domain family 4 member M-like isoform X2 n=1 Tax=Sebastes fasciatus TaxID=394691 RepID=UPI003D9E0EDF